MPITEEELATKRERVEELRQQVAAEETARFERETALTNEVVAAQLDAEATRLQAQLAEAKRANGESGGESSSTVLDSVKAEQALADASLEAANTPTPTPDESGVDDKTKG